MEPATKPATRTGETRDSRPRKALTIGAVCKVLGQEFDDISISKIRYLEDQKLLTPRRTRGGYRLYSQADVEQLRHGAPLVLGEGLVAVLHHAQTRDGELELDLDFSLEDARYCQYTNVWKGMINCEFKRGEAYDESHGHVRRWHDGRSRTALVKAAQDVFF